MPLEKGVSASDETSSPEETSLPLRRVMHCDRDLIAHERSEWSYYNKPATLVVIGGLVFLCGIILTIFHFTKFADVPYALGPVCLSIGLMFLVTGLVWLPIIKQKVRHKVLLKKMYARRARNA
ncbi:phosphoinositide-interacting protein [Protopterus annectens]|uniref:phosphoinositide-interacting protein n=1 Tax=Protopterus annectens TaxID=7888 RepID=UPI001CFA406D|nr:phosphoinositide-interacting protein [Protopterus annectens]